MIPYEQISLLKKGGAKILTFVPVNLFSRGILHTEQQDHSSLLVIYGGKLTLYVDLARIRSPRAIRPNLEKLVINHIVIGSNRGRFASKSKKK